MKSRREIIQLMPFAAAAVLAACGGKPADTASSPAPAPAAEPTPPAPAPVPPEPAVDTSTFPMLDEADPVAAALGYVADSARVDTGKFPNFVAGSQCANCNLYSGAAGEAAGPCSLFTGKKVSATGWCGSYVKKIA
ncbi:MAG: high-potential iron-sulfur protein [Chromatiales bacterium]|nr:high-potential iron-sulfur protein [Chromatiales bacterium]